MHEWVLSVLKNFEGVPAWSWALQVVAVITQFLGAELNARLKISGFYILMIANLTLFVIHITAGLWLILILDVLYFRINIKGLRTWGAKKPESVPPFVRKLLRF